MGKVRPAFHAARDVVQEYLLILLNAARVYSSLILTERIKLSDAARADNKDFKVLEYISGMDIFELKHLETSWPESLSKISERS